MKKGKATISFNYDDLNRKMYIIQEYYYKDDGDVDFIENVLMPKFKKHVLEVIGKEYTMFSTNDKKKKVYKIVTEIKDISMCEYCEIVNAMKLAAMSLKYGHGGI